MTVATVDETDLDDLLPLMRGYCDFYEVAPADGALLALARALIADPRHEGVQLLARDEAGRAVGFATIYWGWSTARAARLALMNDLFVVADARGRGVAAALIEACAERGRAHGAAVLEWETAPDNAPAQRVYGRTGAERSEWVAYDLAL